jgi:hypothetical protein
MSESGFQEAQARDVKRSSCARDAPDGLICPRGVQLGIQLRAICADIKARFSA